MSSSTKPNFAALAANVNSKAKTIEYQETDRPFTSDTFTGKFTSNSGPRRDFSNQHIIDVLPNFVPLICFLMYNVNEIAHLLEASQHAKVSPATIMSYCLAIIYAHFLISDLTFRQPPSVHSASYAETAYKQKFIDVLLALPVPEFLAPVLRFFMPTFDEMRPHIRFIPSAAGFSYRHYFGRLFPLNAFTVIHDCVTEVESRESRSGIMTNLLDRVIYTVNNIPGSQTLLAVNLGNLFGFGLNANGTPVHCNSKLYQMFTAMFNPVLFRDYQRRHHLASVNLSPRTHHATNMNAYDFMFAASPMNFAEYAVVFQAIAPLMQKAVKCTGNLASFYTNISGNEILNHGYSKFALPTAFHSTASFTLTTGSGSSATTTTLTRVDADAYALIIRFMQRPTAPPAQTTLTQPTGTCSNTGTGAHTVTVTYNQVWNRLRPAAPTAPAVPAPSFTTGFPQFDENEHVYPKVYVMNPTDASTVDAWKPCAYGMIIENSDMDGTVIPIPNVDLSLGIENSWFADSAIPQRFAYHLTAFRADNTEPAPLTRNRVLAPRQSRMSAASLLIDRTTVSIPFFATQATHTNDLSMFSGLSWIDHVNWPRAVQSFFGFRTADNRSRAQSDDAPPGTAQGRLLIWSPYTYTSYTDEDNDTPRPSESRIYFLTNMRSIFGTRVPLVEVNHPLEAMPVF